MPLLALFLSCLAAALGWRVQDVCGPWWGFGGSILALLTALVVAWHRPTVLPKALLALALTASVIALAKPVPGLWPCATCRGGEDYEHLWGLSVLWYGVAAYVSLAILASLGISTRPTIRSSAAFLARLTAWTCVGCSLYFCLLSTWLHLVCGHCLAVHTPILALVPLLIRDQVPPTWPLRLALAALAALGLHAVFHPGPAGEGPPPRTGELTADQLNQVLEADRGRCNGPNEAPLRAELVVNLQCPHCAQDVPPLLQGLHTACASGRLRLAVRYRYPSRDPGAQLLARLALAAALAGRHREFLLAQVGTPEHLDEAAVVRRLPPDQADLVQLEQEFRTSLLALQAADKTRLHRLGADRGATPQLRLYRAGQAKPVRIWSDRLPSTDILQVLGSLSGKAEPP